MCMCVYLCVHMCVCVCVCTYVCVLQGTPGCAGVLHPCPSTTATAPHRGAPAGGGCTQSALCSKCESVSVGGGGRGCSKGRHIGGVTHCSLLYSVLYPHTYNTHTHMHTHTHTHTCIYMHMYTANNIWPSTTCDKHSSADFSLVLHTKWSARDLSPRVHP